MAQKSISIKEIAKMANVSVATVSRVINNNGRFSKETKEKIRNNRKFCATGLNPWRFFVLLFQKQGNATKRQRCYRFRTGRCPAFPIKKICLMADFLDILYGFAVIF